MAEQPQAAVTFQGEPLTLEGAPPAVGAEAPDFTALTTDLEEVKLSDYRGKTVVLLTVPSLDTSVCDTEARRFNQEATQLGEDVVILVVSMDLPFAQKRWCGAADAGNVQTLSDHRDASCGQAFGVLIRELRLLARAAFVIDRAGWVAYRQVVSEMTDEPDYADIISAVSAARTD